MEPIDGEIGACFFDLDGTLVDSEPLQLEAIRKILSTYGIEVGEREYYEELLPLPYRETAACILRRAGFGLSAAALDEIARLMERDARLRLLRSARPVPDALACVETAAAFGPIGIVTSSPRTLVEPLLRGWALHGRFQAIVCAGDTARGKPAPDPYLLALRLAGESVGAEIPAASALAFEDSPHGIRSAKAAGMRVVGVATRIAPHRLSEADRVVRHLTPDLLPPRRRQA